MGFDEGLEVEEGFVIDNDNTADWAVRKIKERQEEAERIIAIATSQISEMQERIRYEQEKLEKDCSYLRAKLNEYFWKVSRKETKTTQKYKLLSGELVFKKPAAKAKVTDDAELVRFLEGSELGEYVKVEKKAAWGELKSMLDFSTGMPVLPITGEVVPGIDIEESEGKFEVK